VLIARTPSEDRLAAALRAMPEIVLTFQKAGEEVSPLTSDRAPRPAGPALTRGSIGL